MTKRESMKLMGFTTNIMQDLFFVLEKYNDITEEVTRQINDAVKDHEASKRIYRLSVKVNEQRELLTALRADILALNAWR